MVLLKNKKGFTLISMLVAISALAMALPLLGYMLNSFKSGHYYEEMDIQNFFIFIRNEMAIADYVQIDNGRIVYEYMPEEDTDEDEDEEDVEIVTIEQYNDLIRRRVKNKGHDIYLRNVNSVYFEKLPYGLKVSVYGTGGEFHEKHFSLYNRG